MGRVHCEWRYVSSRNDSAKSAHRHLHHHITTILMAFYRITKQLFYKPYCTISSRTVKEALLRSWVYFTNLIKFYQNIEAWNHGTNIHCRILQDSSQRVIEFNTEYVHIKTAVQSFMKADVWMMENLQWLCNTSYAQTFTQIMQNTHIWWRQPRHQPQKQQQWQ